MRFRNVLVSFGVIVMAVCASIGQTPSAGESGIEGIITIGPARPGPTRIDGPGSVPFANAIFVIENGDREVASFTTDDKGYFRALVPPAHYKVSLKGKTGIGRFGPFEVDVAPGKITKVEWECDSGIR